MLKAYFTTAYEKTMSWEIPEIPQLSISIIRKIKFQRPYPDHKDHSPNCQLSFLDRNVHVVDVVNFIWDKLKYKLFSMPLMLML